ncbi:MAG: hypothetical protein HQ478_03130 [Chloroflexi bacterium]|nr:hypothetical protein [Chloroflexota bacterium]
MNAGSIRLLMMESTIQRVGLKTRLVFAFTLIVTITLIMAAGVFVILQREELERRVISGVNDAAPGILGSLHDLGDATTNNSGDLTALISEQGLEFGVRILTVDSMGAVVQDSESVLQGFNLTLVDRLTDQFQTAIRSLNKPVAPATLVGLNRPN